MSANPKLAAAVDEFLRSCQADMLSDATIRWYQQRLIAFRSAMGDVRLKEISSAGLRSYIIGLSSRDVRFANARQRPCIDGGLSPDTLRGHIRALRRFFTWSAAEYRMSTGANPMQTIRLTRRGRPEPKAVKLCDVALLMQNTTDDPFGKRDRAILAFLIDTGCRANGLLTLRLADVDLDAGRASVTEKGNRSRLVAFVPRTADYLRDWSEVRPVEASTFFCALGSNTAGAALTLSGLHSIIRRLKRRAGIEGRTNPHSFRHAYAREWLRAGGDLGNLSVSMGHSDPSVTLSSYGIFTDEEALNSHAQFSPMNRIQL